jgi:L-fuculose-phosphate aldolase
VSSSANLRATLVAGCRILADAGQEHFQLGHISARADGTGTIWLKAAGIGLGEVGNRDFVAISIESGPAEGAKRIHQEWPIHTEIYHARPDVMAVVHTHPLAAAAVSASTGNFQYVSQDSLLFPTGVGTFADPRLVTTRDRGQSLARALGPRSAVLLRNHGLVTVGRTPQEAVVLAVSLDRSLQIQGLARSFGVVRPIDRNTADEMIEYFRDHYPGRIETIWRFLDRRQRAGKIGDRLEPPRSAGPGPPGNSLDEGVREASDAISRYHQKAADLQSDLSDAAEPAVIFVAKE